MAQITNDKDLILQGTTPRVVDLSTDYISLSVNTSTIVVRASGVATPSSFIATPFLNGELTDINSITWSVNPAVAYSVNSSTKAIEIQAAALTAGTPVTVTASLLYQTHTKTASHTITKISNIAAADLTATNIVLPANSSGTVLTYNGASTTMSVYVGNQDDSANWTYNVTKTNVTTSEATTSRTQTVTSLTGDLGYITITASKTGFDSISKTFVVSKQAAGAQGIQGVQGIEGVQGDPGIKTFSGLVYYTGGTPTGNSTNPPSTSTSNLSGTYNFSDNTFSSLSANWSLSAPIFQAGNDYKYWYSRFTVVESSSGSNSGTASFSPASQTIGFSGLVTFSSATPTTLTTSSGNTFNYTAIDGGNITTGIIKSTNYSYTSGNFSTTGTQFDLSSGLIRSKNFLIDSSGNATFAGTITSTALIGSTAASTVVSGAASGATSLQPGSAASDVNNNSTTISGNKIRTGIIESTGYSYSSGNFSTTGTQFDLSTGLIRSKNFLIDSSGNATFGGQLSSATGTFAGELITGTGSNRIVINENNNLEIQGYTTEGGTTPWFSLGVGNGPPTDALNKSVFKIYASSFPFNANVVDIRGGKTGYYAVSINNSALSPASKGLEVRTFDAESVVIARTSTIVGGDAATITNAKGTVLKLTAASISYHALHLVTGTFNYGGVTIATPPNNTTQYLRADGTWQTITGSYTLPLAASGTRGGVQTGYTNNNQNYAVQLDANEKMYVNVPWTDTDTVYSLPLAANGTRGGVQVGYTTTGRNYAVQLSGEQMYVNVPWTDTDTDTVTRLRGTTTGTFASGDVTLAAGSNVSINQVGTTITINSSYTDTDTVTNLRAGTGDTYINGNITFVGSGATTVSRSGNTITISSTDNVGSGADGNTYVTSASFSGGSLTLTRNDNVTVSVSLDGRYLTSVSWTDVTGKPSFATVATSGSYTDLTNKPTIPAAQIQSDWNQSINTALDYIKNKPTLFSGNYNDLTNKPTIPAAQIQSDWDQSTITALDYIKNKPTIPTNTNQLTNGAGFYKSGDSMSTGNLTVTGSISATGEITAYSSDNRLKTNIESIVNAIDKLKQLNGVTYNWNALANTYGFDTTVKQAGLLAQEVQAVLPEAVKPAPFDINEHGNSRSGENYITIQYEKLIPLLVEAIKEQQTQIDQLKRLLETR